MGKQGKEKGEARTRIVFKTVVKEVEKLTGKIGYTLGYDEGTGRFNLSRNDSRGMLVSSASLKDCVLAAEEHGVKFSPEEQKVTFKAIG